MKDFLNRCMFFSLKREELLALAVILANVVVHISYPIYVIYYGVVAYINLSLYIVMLIKFKMYRYEKAEFIFVALVICYAVIVSVFNGNSIGAVVAFIELFLVLSIFSKHTFSNGAWKVIAFFSVLVVVRYFLKISAYYYNWMLNMHDSLNPNTVGMFMYFAFIVFLYYAISISRFNKAFFFLVWLLTIYCEYKLSCRTYSMVVIAVGIFWFFLSHAIWQKKRFVIMMIVFFFALGCLVPYWYSLQSSSKELSILIHKYTGKYLYTGRERAWSNFFKYELNNRKAFLFGAGSWIEKSFSENFSLHNSYLGIIMNFGIFGLILYLAYIVYVVNGIYLNKEMQDYQIVLVIGFMGFLIASFTEVTVQTPISALPIGMLLAAANNKQNI
ncbi:MAG: hypothetical protein NC416_03880 [Eubacterium sp.]|nr:hypothetical protein [Eubacterium sp.]